MPEQQFDVFLAHSSKDKPLIRQIYRQLKTRGIRPWLDEEEIAPGTKFQDEIQQAIKQIKTAAIFFGKGGLGGWQALELKSFISQCVERNIPIIPVLLPGVENIPEELIFLQEFHAVFFKDNIEDKKALFQLEWGITGTRPTTPSPPPSPLPPPPSPDVNRKELYECEPSKLLFIKNVRDPNGGWAYTLDRIQQMGASLESRVFELFWLPTSKGARSASKGDLMILNQHAKVTHVVEMLDDEIRKNDAGYFRWVQIVWLPAQKDWSQLPHQREILGFEPPTIGGGATYSFASPNFGKFRAAWENLGSFQQHVFKMLIGTEGQP
ncbi:MAG: toll/interleukin-1 receptor domain-containing protein [Leptolyngbya sp. SIO1E4]|nr:toll/interleukin-1 receptor domain-containing protein [Leptolyngbya sp. SIO1E4]